MRAALLRCLAVAIALVAGLVPAAAECLRPPPAIRDLDLPRFYSDDAGSIVDPELLAKHRAAVEPLTDFLRNVTGNADKSVRRTKLDQQAEPAVCALVWLDAWARGEAWLGNMSTRQGEYQRKWDLGGVALAYLKVRAFATEDERRRIEDWLMRWADIARTFFDDPERKRNNHWYWLGLGMGAVGLAANSPKHWDMAREIMKDAAKDIQADGTLPQEMDRKARALHYHVFAVTPLVALAELGRARGEDWYCLGDGALHRLVALAARGLRDPKMFEAMPLVATPQEPDTNPGAGWLILYGQHFKARVEPGWPAVNPSHRWLGGDVQVLAKVLGTAP